METRLDLHAIVEKFSIIDHAVVGRGPRHPTNPMLNLKPTIDDFLKTYPFLSRDTGYLDFLECYAGTEIHPPEKAAQGWFFSLFGFYIGWAGYVIANPDEYIWEWELKHLGMFPFADAQIFDHNDSRNDIFAMAAFNVACVRKPGIYQRVQYRSELSEDRNYVWYCDTFLEWFQAVAETGGAMWRR